MQKHLFLTGPAGCGKSEAIRQALGPSLLSAGGFMNKNERGDSGALLRASLVPAAVFRGEGVRLLQEAGWYPFSVLDAIGGFELLIPQFRAALADTLSSEQPLVGVLMARKEAETLCRRLGLGERVQMNIAQLWKALEADRDTLIVDLHGMHRRRALHSLEQWAEEYAG